MMIYDPEKQTVEFNGQTINFYCGKDFNDTATVLAMLAFGRTSLQDAYIDIMEINNNSIDDDIKMFIIKEMKLKYEYSIKKMVEDGVLVSGSGCEPPKTGVFSSVKTK